MDDSLKSSIVRGAIGLGLFAMVTAGLIAVTQVSTADAIAAAQARAEARSLHELIEEGSTTVPLLEAAFEVPADDALGLRKAGKGYRAIRSGKVFAVILPFTAREGYNGDIHGIAAIDRVGTLLGVRIIAHKETPGLGDQIEIRKSPWVRQFEGKSLRDPAADLWKVRKDGGAFDQMTGATITPRAVVGQVARVLTWFEAHRRELLTLPEQEPAS
ncbi:MAG: electron transport complex subunit RsxG [Gammaproteobacteria bacterium]|nr:MAG: electron transport complex subunit RsxG [Gammaproteobacteria bacterium]